MIRLLDANALVTLYDERRSIDDLHACCVIDEIADEFKCDAVAEAWLDALPLYTAKLDDADYLDAYARYLNQFSGVSFYSLKGFGDVALLATLDLLVRELPATPTLSRAVFPENNIFLVTDDRRLRNFVARKFGAAVTIETYEVFSATL